MSKFFLYTLNLGFFLHYLFTKQQVAGAAVVPGAAVIVAAVAAVAAVVCVIAVVVATVAVIAVVVAAAGATLKQIQLV